MHVYDIFFIISFASRCIFTMHFCVNITFVSCFIQEFLSARIVPPVLPRFLLYSLVLIFLTSKSRIHLTINESYFVLCPGCLFMFSSVFFFLFIFYFLLMSNSILFFLDKGGGDSFYSHSSSLLRHYLLTLVSKLSKPPFFVSRTILQAHNRHSPRHIEL